MLSRIDVFPVGDETVWFEGLCTLEVCTIFHDLDLTRHEVVMRPDLGFVFYVHYKDIKTAPPCLKAVLEKIEIGA